MDLYLFDVLGIEPVLPDVVYFVGFFSVNLYPMPGMFGSFVLSDGLIRGWSASMLWLCCILLAADSCFFLVGSLWYACVFRLGESVCSSLFNFGVFRLSSWLRSWTVTPEVGWLFLNWSGHVLVFVVIRTRLLSSLLYNPSGKNGAGARFKGILTVVPGWLMNELFWW